MGISLMASQDPSSPGSMEPKLADEALEVRWLSGMVTHIASGMKAGEMSRALAQSRGIPEWAQVRLVAGSTELEASEVVWRQQEPLTALVVFGPMALSGAGDATLRLWALDTCTCLGTLFGHSGAISSVNVCFPQFRAISTSRDCTLRHWDLARMSCIGVLNACAPIVASAADFSQNRAVSCCQDRLIHIWDLVACTCVAQLRGHLGDVRALVIDGCQVISGSLDRTLRIWQLPHASAAAGNAPSGDPLCSGVLAGHSFGVRAVAANFACDLAVSGADDGVLRIWDLSTKACTGVLEGHGRPICSIAVDAERSLVWSAAGQGNLKVWDLSLRCCRETLSGHEGRVAVAVDLERGLAVSGGEEGDLKVWEVESLSCSSTKSAAHRGPVQTVAV